MMATTTKTASITRPMITLGPCGRRSARGRPGSPSGSPSGRGAPPPATAAMSVVFWAISSSRLPRPGVDEHADDIRQEVGGQHHQGDDHEDPLHQAVIELAQGLVEVVSDP